MYLSMKTKEKTRTTVTGEAHRDKRLSQYISNSFSDYIIVGYLNSPQ
jgi:hypothetical protein